MSRNTAERRIPSPPASAPNVPSALRVPSKEHLATLDGVRGLAVCLVLVAHLPVESFARLPEPIAQLLHIAGYFGVDLFFVLSGFLITRILIAEKAKSTPVRYFYARRALRLFPVYYLMLGIYALVHPDPALWACAAYVSNYYFALGGVEPPLLAHTWSLAVEEHFYLVWPFLVGYFTTEKAWRVLWTLLAVSIASSTLIILFEVPQARNLIYSGSLSRMFSLCVGSLLAYREFLGRRPSSLDRHAPFAVGSLIVGVGLVLGNARSAWAFVAYVVGFSVLSLGVLITALHAESRSHRGLFWRALTLTPLIFTGRISYGLYVLHPFAYAVAFSAAFPGDIGWLRAVAACAGTFALASASFYGLERHCLRLKRLFV